MLIPKSSEMYIKHVRDNAISCANQIAKTYNCSQKHFDNIRKFAYKIFDKMKGIHGLDRKKRLLLKLAAILHESGHYVTTKHHLLSAFDLIKNIDIYGMAENEMLITAYITRYNKLVIPNYEDIEFIKLSDNINARILQPNTVYTHIDRRGKTSCNCQKEFYKKARNEVKKFIEQNTDKPFKPIRKIEK